MAEVGTVGMIAVVGAAWGAGGGRGEGGPVEEVPSSMAETSAEARVVGVEVVLWWTPGSLGQDRTFVAAAAIGGETGPAAAGVAAAASSAVGARDVGFDVALVACAVVATVVSAVDYVAVYNGEEHVRCLVDDECGGVPEPHLLPFVQGHVNVGLVQAVGMATAFESGGDLEMEPEWDLGFGLAAQEAGEIRQPPREGWVWS